MLEHSMRLHGMSDAPAILEHMFEAARRVTRLGKRSPRGASIACVDATVPAEAVAVELRRRLPGLGVKKQHKLLYYAQGHHLATFGRPLFAEPVSAYDRGPIVGRLWFAEKTHGQATKTDVTLDESQLNTIGYVLSRYGALSGADLERLTHTESPWLDADKGRRPGTRARISNESMRAYFMRHDDDEADESGSLDTDELTAWLSTVEPYDASRVVQPDDPEVIRARLRSAGGLAVDA